MSHPAIRIDAHPVFLDILDRCSVICKARRDYLITRRRLQIPRMSQTAVARRIAMIAAFKYFDNMSAVARAFGRSVSTVWRLVHEANENEIATAADIVAEFAAKEATCLVTHS